MRVQCAWAAKGANNSYCTAQFFCLQAGRGPQSHLRGGGFDPDCHLSRAQERNFPSGSWRRVFRLARSKIKRLARQIASLGYDVTFKLTRLKQHKRRALSRPRVRFAIWMPIARPPFACLYITPSYKCTLAKQTNFSSASHFGSTGRGQLIRALRKTL
jgi:hypothetical protein